MARAGGVIRVYPDAERVEQALVDAAARGSGFVDASGFLSFAQLIERCEPARLLGRRPCSPLTARVVLWSAARALPPGPFKAFVHEPAFARAAQELFFELKAASCPPDELLSAVQQLPASRRARGLFLAKLFAEYERRMEELRLIDREDLLRGALEAVSRELPRMLSGARAIELHQLYDFPPLRLRFVLALAERCQAEGVGFKLALPGAGAPSLDAAVDEVLQGLERKWRTLEVDVEKLVPENRPLASLSRVLFTDRVAPEPPSALFAFSAGSAREEARQLAQRARRLVDEGCPPEEIAIAFRDLSEEAEEVCEALERVGVPARFRLGAPLASTSVGRLALELPLLVDDGFPAERVVRYLESRYAPEVSLGSPHAPAALLAMASIRDDRVGAAEGKGAYQVRLDGLAARLERTGRKEKAKVARRVLASARRLIELGEAIPVEASAGKLLERWWASVEGLGLFDAIRRGESAGPSNPREGPGLGRAVVRALARDQAAAEALRALVAELDEAWRLSGTDAQPMSRRTFHRWLADAAGDFNLAPKGPRGGAVRILDLRQLVGSRARHLFVGGMVDGRFPGRGKPHPVFPDEDRALVNRAARRGVFRLSTGEADGRLPWRLAEDRLLLHAALTAATETTTLSFARRSASGQELLASPFLDELARAVGLRVAQVPQVPVPPLDEVDDELELRERVALEAFGRPELRTSAADPARPLLAERFAKEPWFAAARALTAIEEERLRFFSDPTQPPGPHSGAACSPELAKALQERFEFGPSRPASASLLGKFGNCAFSGFLSYALGLEEPETAGEELDSRGRGSFWHQVLELLFPRLKEAGLLGRPPEELPPELLDRVLAEAAAEIEARDHVGHPALWRLGRERARAMIRRILGAERRGLPFDGQLPRETELPFGREGAPERWREVVLPPAAPPETAIHLAGSIDRLDEGEGALGVIDYKSSTRSAKKLYEALLATEFQLPLYLFAARSSGGEATLRAAWLSMRDGEALLLEEVLGEGELTLEELLATAPEERARLAREERKNFANAVHGLVAGLREGKFPARPEDCGVCSYKAVCRISERRLSEASDA